MRPSSEKELPLSGSCAFVDIPADEFLHATGSIRPVGLARIVYVNRNRVFRARRRPHDCLLSEAVHLHVHRLRLDFDEMEKPAKNWPRQLATIAADPENEEIIH